MKFVQLYLHKFLFFMLKMTIILYRPKQATLRSFEAQILHSFPYLEWSQFFLLMSIESFNFSDASIKCINPNSFTYFSDCPTS